MTTNNIPSAEDLLPLIAAFKTAEQVEAFGFTFEHDTVPSVGDLVIGFSRGCLRQGIVTHVTKTNTVTFAYITEGGVKEAQGIVDSYRASDPERRYNERKSHDLKKRAEYQDVVDGKAAGLSTLSIETYQGFIDKMTDEAIEEAAAKERDRVAENKAKSVFDFVNVTTKSIKAKDGRVQVAVKR